MKQYLSIINLIYPINLDDESWFLYLYQNLILSVILENEGRTFSSDEIVNYLYKNYQIKVENIEEYEYIIESLVESDKLLKNQNKLKVNPEQKEDLQHYLERVQLFDDEEDQKTMVEFSELVSQYVSTEEPTELWNYFYEDVFLPLVYQFYIRLTNPNFRTETGLLEYYSRFLSRYTTNQHEIHEVAVHFLKAVSRTFFKKHLIGCIFYESLNGSLKEHETILKLIERPDTLDLFIERNISFFMEIMQTMHSVDDRLRSATNYIATLLFEDAFSKNLYFFESTNKQADSARSYVINEASKLITDLKAENAELKELIGKIQTDTSDIYSKIDVLKDNYSRQNKTIYKVQYSVDEKQKQNNQNSINQLKNKNVEIINKITEMSMVMIPIGVIVISLVYYFVPEYLWWVSIPFAGGYLLRLLLLLFEMLLNYKIILHYGLENDSLASKISSGDPETNGKLEVTEVTKVEGSTPTQ